MSSLHNHLPGFLLTVGHLQRLQADQGRDLPVISGDHPNENYMAHGSAWLPLGPDARLPGGLPSLQSHESTIPSSYRLDADL